MANLRRRPLLDLQSRPSAIAPPPNPCSPSITDVFAHACKLGAEGIVSKRLGSPYRSGPCAGLGEVHECGNGYCPSHQIECALPKFCKTE